MENSAGSGMLDGGDPLLEPRSFRRCLGQYATGVTIITTRSGDVLAGVTANSFASVSLDPPLVLWSISRKSRSFEAFASATHFAINILASDQIGISQHFSGSDTDKFAGVSWSVGRNGVPLIDDAIAFFECSVEATHQGGDHIILIGRVEYFARFEGEPLLFVQGRYGIAEDLPDFAASQTLDTAADTAPNGKRPLLPVLFQAYHHISAKFDEHRRAEGVTLAQGRALATLHQNPSITLDELVQATYLGRRDAEDAISGLVERKLVRRDASARLSLTPEGTERRLAISRRWTRFQSEQLDGIPAGDIAVARDVLEKMVTKPANR